MRPSSSLLPLLLVVAFLAPAARAEEGCRLAQFAEVHVSYSPAGGVLLPVTAGGNEAWLILGMNSGISGIFPQAVELLGLKPLKLTKAAGTGSHLQKDADIIKSGRKDLNLYVKYEALQLGQINLSGMEAIIAVDGPPALPRFGGRPVLGRIGSALFKQFDVELDLLHDTVRIYRQAVCDSPPVYWAKEFTVVPLTFDVSGTLTFTMDLDGHKIRTALATDVGRSMLEERTTGRYFGFKPDAPDLERMVLPNGQRVVFRPMSLTAEGVTVNHARVQLYERRDTQCKLGRARDGAIAYDNCFNITPFAIGAELLQKLRLYISGKRDEIYITAATP